MPAYISRYKKVSFSIVLHIHVCVVFFICLPFFNKNGGGGGVTLRLKAHGLLRHLPRSGDCEGSLPGRPS